jgi:transcriptional regulator with XRE-family HTH domain
MKEVEQKEAIRLRKEDGLSILEISNRLKVAKSSVSNWVRKVVLTDEQKAILLSKNPAFNNQHKGGEVRKENALKIRQQFQEDGRRMARKGDIDFIAVCMLYWGEGSKSKCRASLVNTDFEMLKMFVNVLRKEFGVNSNEFVLVVQWYSDNGLDIDEIKEYWSESLDLPLTCFRKCRVDNISKYSQKKKKNRHPYGTCSVVVHRTDIVQKIYGAIQEIGKFEKEEWLW